MASEKAGSGFNFFYPDENMVLPRRARLHHRQADWLTGSRATRPGIPTRFRCNIGGEWKPLDSFSKNQQRIIQHQIDGRVRIDAANSGMVCREHAPGQRTEMACELCGLVKPLDCFSSSSKRSGSANCKRCTAWIETQEPEVIPAPLETGHISIEEERGEMWPASFVDSTDFFSDDLLPQAPVTGLSSLGLDDLDACSVDMNSLLSAPSDSFASAGASEAGSTSRRPLPPHLRGMLAGTGTTLTSLSIERLENTGLGSSSSSSSIRPPRRGLPPHLRGITAIKPPPCDTYGDGDEDAASDCAVMSDGSYEPSSISTATTAREEARAADKLRQVSFNAWDPKGMKHRGIRSVTASSVTGDSATAASNAGDEAQSSAKEQSKGKWAKAKDTRMSRAELLEDGTNHHIAARQVGPAVHRPPQRDFSKFCEPDEDEDEGDFY
ncbi:stc1 domain-containing [Trichoderma cornu-damae]|uniref:Stc1 domain-containing n=1 Tax=Trichoderma cornu-damae TaxID=654480 RepID=A0A9P8QFN1_9HYPO|nr:stc1 domain-containing [Trichoderma cornu-damae]